jgi:hypothetical protein
MARIKTRNAAGGEFTFPNQVDLARAVQEGWITREWQIFHATTSHWLPITVHPAFGQAFATRRDYQPAPRPSAELILTFPGSHDVPAAQPEGHRSPAQTYGHRRNPVIRQAWIVMFLLALLAAAMAMACSS